MSRYYTRVCNFYYGTRSKILVQKNKTLPLHGIKEISFDQIEIITRKSKKKIFISNIKKLQTQLQKKINFDLKKITSSKKNFSNLNFKLQKPFFFEVIFFKSKLIFFFNECDNLLIWLMNIFFLDFLEIISIWLKEISLIPLSGSDLFFFTRFLELSP